MENGIARGKGKKGRSSLLSLKFLNFYYLFIFYVHTCAHTSMWAYHGLYIIVREDNVWEWVLFFHQVCSGD